MEEVNGTILSEKEKKEATLEFESQLLGLKQSFCSCCYTVSMLNKTNKKGICTWCVSLKDAKYYLEQDALPVWYENGNKDNPPQYDIPEELVCLSQAEKMLIQQLSPFVPLAHIKNGTCGLSGYVCAFEQDVNDFIKCLPHCLDDTALLRVVKTVQTEVGGKSNVTEKTF